MRCFDLPYILENGANCRIIRTTFSWHIYILDDRWRRYAISQLATPSVMIDIFLVYLLIL